MKKIILFIVLLSAIFVSCETPNVTKTNTGVIYNENGDEVQIIIIDGCQYVGDFYGTDSDWGAHKGDCNNPIHQQTKVTIVDTVEYKLIRE